MSLYCLFLKECKKQYLVDIFYKHEDIFFLIKSFMLKHQSVEIIKTFSKHEEKEFLKFISSPFFNRSKKIVQLYKVLLTYRNDFDSEELNKEFVYGKMKQTEKYSDSTMRNLLADLYILLKKYLTYKRFSIDYEKQEILFLKEASVRKLNKQVSINLDLLTEKLNNSGGLSFDRFFDISELKDIQYRHFYLNQSKFNKENIKTGELLLNDIVFYLLFYSVYRLIMYENDYIVLCNNFSEKAGDSELDKLYEIFSSLDFEKVFGKNDVSLRYINLFFKITNAFKNSGAKNGYDAFKKDFDALKGSMPKRIEYDLCKLAIYFNDQLINRDEDVKYVKDAFYFVKYMVDNKLYVYSDLKQINQFMFRSIANHGINNKEFKWVDEFINNNSGSFDPEKRNNAVNLARAAYHFGLKDYNKAIEHINEINTENRLLNAEAKLIMLKSYYDSGQFELLKYSIENFQKLIKTDFTFGDNYKTLLTNFLKYLRKLLSHKLRIGKSSDLDYYYSKLLEENNVINKLWLKKKFEEVI